MYTLSFADASSKQIWSEFTFSGTDVSVSCLSLDWQYVAYAGRYTLYGISFKLENTGDLPMYVDKAPVTIQSFLHSRVILLQGNTSALSSSASMPLYSCFALAMLNPFYASVYPQL
jgi:hypothetical protein